MDLGRRRARSDESTAAPNLSKAFCCQKDRNVAIGHLSAFQGRLDKEKKLSVSNINPVFNTRRGLTVYDQITHITVPNFHSLRRRAGGHVCISLGAKADAYVVQHISAAVIMSRGCSSQSRLTVSSCRLQSTQSSQIHSPLVIISYEAYPASSSCFHLIPPSQFALKLCLE